MDKESERILQECLERLQQGQEELETVLEGYPEQAEWLRQALQARAWLARKQPIFEARPGFVAASRKRLVAQLPRRGVFYNPLAGWNWSTRLHRRWVYSFLFVILAGLLSLNGVKVAQAAPSWMPGDFPYPIKTAYEGTTLAVSLSREGDAQLHIEFARRRLLEIQALVIEGRYDEIAPAGANFEFHITQAVTLIEQIARRDPLLARRLALELQATLGGQQKLMALLGYFLPRTAKVDYERVRAVSRSGAAAVQELISPNGRRPLPERVFNFSCDCCLT